VPVLIEHAQLSVLMEILLVMDDIPAYYLIQILKFFLCLPDSTIKEKLLDLSEAYAIPRHTITNCEGISLLLNLIVSSPVNFQFLQDSLKLLNTEHLKVLLSYFVECLSYHGRRSLQSLDKKLDKFRVPSLKLILAWSSKLIDVHYSRFLVEKELSALGLELHELVGCHVQLGRELHALSGCLSQMLSGTLPKKDTAQYEIRKTLS